MIRDGHTSRWNKDAIDLLIENEIFHFFFPNHTSVWTHPNDCGINKRLHTCVEKEINDMSCMKNIYCVMLFNIVIKSAWEDFLDCEQKDLLATKQYTTSSWRFVGLYLFFPDPEIWNDILLTLGKLKGLMWKDNNNNKRSWHKTTKFMY